MTVLHRKQALHPPGKPKVFPCPMFINFLYVTLSLSVVTKIKFLLTVSINFHTWRYRQEWRISTKVYCMNYDQTLKGENILGVKQKLLGADIYIFWMTRFRSFFRFFPPISGKSSLHPLKLKTNRNNVNFMSNKLLESLSPPSPLKRTMLPEGDHFVNNNKKQHWIWEREK